MALAILIRYGGQEEDRMVAPVRTLLDERRLGRARVDRARSAAGAYGVRRRARPAAADPPASSTTRR